MSLMLVLWLLAFAICLVLSFTRPAWAVALYMLTFFLAPAFWWWGKPVASIRWNLYAGLLILVTTVISGAAFDRRLLQKVPRWFLIVAFLTMINATLVHNFLAPNPDISGIGFVLMLKTFILFGLMTASLQSEKSLKIVTLAIVLGAMYIGYEVTINDRGKLSGGRLEGVGVANATTANDLACLMVTTLPMAVPFFLTGNLLEKIIGALAAPMILNVVLLCNSRGAFLALIMLGVAYVVGAPKSIRPQVIRVSLLGLLALWMLLGDPRIIERFMTTFKGAEERDNSAISRLQFWQAGFLMIKDHPFGAGGDGFKDVYGAGYIGKVTGKVTARSVHQGYINEACEWGLQGLALRLAMLLGGLRVGWRASRQAIQSDKLFVACVSLSAIAGLAGMMMQSLFGTFLDDEWGLWLVAIIIGCHRLSLADEDEISPFEHSSDDPLPATT